MAYRLGMKRLPSGGETRFGLKSVLGLRPLIPKMEPEEPTPEEPAPEVPFVVFFDEYIEIPLEGSAWQNVDLSPFGVPPGAVVIIRAGNDTANRRVGARNTGSGDNRISQIYQMQVPVYGRCDDNGIIQLYKDTNTRYFLEGYFNPDAAGYFDSGIAETVAAGDWREYVCDVPDGSTFAIFEMQTGAATVGFNLRMHGSTDNIKPTYSSMHCWMIVGLGEDKKVDIYKEGTGTTTRAWLVGYIKVATAKTNTLDISIGTLNEYVMKDLSGDAGQGDTGVIVDVQMGGVVRSFDLKKYQSDATHYYPGGAGASGTYIVPLSSDKKIDLKVSGTGVSFLAAGYV